MKWTTKLFWLAMIVFAGVSCRDRKPDVPVSYEQIKEDLLEMNRKKAGQESAMLEKYIEENKWDAIRTGTGVYVYIYEVKDSTAQKAALGQLALINYELRLLDGTLCYTTATEGAESFRIGQDDVESGLHEGVQYLRPGDKAKILIPSFLAHGFTGDQNKIPQDSPIVYDLELIELR